MTAELEREHNTYNNFELALNGHSKTEIHQFRRKAFERFVELGWPTQKMESWKYTNLDDLKQFELQPSRAPRMTVALAGGTLPKGVIIGSLAQAFLSHPNFIRQHFGQHIKDGALIALNTAFTLDGAFIYLPEGVVLNAPLHIVSRSTKADENRAVYPRILLIAEPNSRAQIIETHVSEDAGAYFSNGVTEMVLASSAEIEHIKIVNESPGSYHFGSAIVVQAARSSYRSFCISLNGKVARDEIHVRLCGEGASCQLFGLHVGGPETHIDGQTQIEHVAPNCKSSELYKGIFANNAVGVFDGMILVHPKADKTDSAQHTHNLLLSENAVVHAKPHLEIYTDDVKCVHGATVGQLDEATLFYLRSRGICESEAKRMLIQSFAGEIVKNLGVDLQEPIWERLRSLI